MKHINTHMQATHLYTYNNRTIKRIKLNTVFAYIIPAFREGRKIRKPEEPEGQVLEQNPRQGPLWAVSCCILPEP